MKPKYQAKGHKKNIPAPDKVDSECGKKLEQAIEEIQSRATNVGIILEGIIEAHPCHTEHGHRN